MTAIALSRPDLFSQVQAGLILGLDRRTVAEIARAMGLAWKRDLTRPNALLLDRSDIDRIADALGIDIDWDSLLVA